MTDTMQHVVRIWNSKREEVVAEFTFDTQAEMDTWFAGKGRTWWEDYPTEILEKRVIHVEWVWGEWPERSRDQ